MLGQMAGLLVSVALGALDHSQNHVYPERVQRVARGPSFRPFGVGLIDACQVPPPPQASAALFRPFGVGFIEVPRFPRSCPQSVVCAEQARHNHGQEETENGCHGY